VQAVQRRTVQGGAVHRRTAQGGHSARSLLLTVLGEFVLPSGGTAWTASLVEAMEALGVEEGTARQAIARTAGAGLLRSTRFGRRMRWQLSPAAVELLTRGTERIYSFGQPAAHPGWDGRWTLILTTVPETNRSMRYRMRSRLGWCGFAPIGPGVWVSPWVERRDEALAALGGLGLAGVSRSFVGSFGPPGDQRALAHEAWNLDQLDAEYRGFVARHAMVAPASEVAAFAALVLLVHEWRYFPTADPGLPPELLPSHWSGEEAAALFHRVHGEWSPAASAWWMVHSDPGRRPQRTSGPGPGPDPAPGLVDDR
jgi:phenylacetic acid degradation operon negative regulatory protein